MLSNKYLINKNEVVWRNIESEAVILNLDTGYYYTINEVGTKIWEAIDKQKSLSEIFNSLKEEYQVSEVQLKRDILRLVEDLKEEKLIEIKK